MGSIQRGWRSTEAVIARAAWRRPQWRCFKKPPRSEERAARGRGPSEGGGSRPAGSRQAAAHWPAPGPPPAYAKRAAPARLGAGPAVPAAARTVLCASARRAAAQQSPTEEAGDSGGWSGEHRARALRTPIPSQVSLRIRASGPGRLGGGRPWASAVGMRPEVVGTSQVNSPVARHERIA